jgi:subtilase family serine protease
LVSIAPQSIQVIYQTGSAAVVKNSSCGVIEFVDQYFSPSDLATFSTQFRVAIPPLTANHIIGRNDPNNPQVEADLDIQWALGIGVKATGWFD